jgi:hypothetical protein
MRLDCIEEPNMMRNGHIWLATACFVALAALSPPPTAAIEQQKPSTDSAELPETVLTGCLKSHGADTAIAGPSGRLYTLEVIEMAKPVGPTTSTAAGTPPAASTTTYSLDNVGKVELEKHADHQVQLTGRMQTPSKAAQTSAPVSPAGTPAAKPSPGGGHRTFHVTGLKMIAAKCVVG